MPIFFVRFFNEIIVMKNKMCDRLAPILVVFIKGFHWSNNVARLTFEEKYYGKRTDEMNNNHFIYLPFESATVCYR